MLFLRAVGRIVLAAAAVSSVVLAADHPSTAQAPLVQVSAARTPLAQASLVDTHLGATPPDGEIGTLEAGVGAQCGAYREDSSWHADIIYRHCGPGRVRIEIDHRD